MAGDPSTWASTTHAWASMVDREHLQDVRDRCKALTGGSLRHVVDPADVSGLDWLDVTVAS
jgi:hypothetical protein